MFVPLTLTAQIVTLNLVNGLQIQGIVLFAFVTSIVPLVSAVADRWSANRQVQPAL